MFCKMSDNEIKEAIELTKDLLKEMTPLDAGFYLRDLDIGLRDTVYIVREAQKIMGLYPLLGQGSKIHQERIKNASSS